MLKNCSLLFAVLPLLTMACATTPESSRTAVLGSSSFPGALVVAQNALAEERYEDARQWLVKALKQDPGDDRANLLLAEVHLATGSADKALGLFEKLEASSEVAAEAKQGKAIALMAEGHAADAYPILRGVVASNPELWRSWNALGLYYDSVTRWPEAAEAYERAKMQAGFEAGIPLNNWGMSLLAQSKYAQAEKKFADALEHDPDFALANSNLRLCMALQGKYEQALVGAQGDTLPAILNNIGYAAMVRGDREAAQSYLLRAMDESPRYHDTAAHNLQLVDSVNPSGQR